MPGYLIPEDLITIADHLGLTVEQLVDRYLRASSGATAIAQGQLVQIPTLVPVQKPNGHCVWYAQGECRIHCVSPFGCAAFSVCNTDDDQRLRNWGLEQVYRSDAYRRARDRAKPARPLDARKAAFAQRLHKITKKARRRKNA
jgi:hypothetical protein